MLPLYFFAQETVAGETATEDSVEGGISSVPTIADPATASATKAVADILPEGTPEWVQTSVVYGIPYGIGALKVLVILLITWMIAGIASRLVIKGLEKTRFDETLTKFFAKIARWGVLALGVLSCLSIFGVETTSFAALIGAMGLAIGLAFQGTLSNFASGVMLLIFRPFKVGQFVKVGGEAGTINEIDLFTIALDTSDNRRIIIPNSKVFGATIENVSFHSKRRVDVNVGTAYEADLDKTREVLMNAILLVENRLVDPESVVVLLELNASTIDWQVRVWCKSDLYWDVRQDLIRAIKNSLDRAGIGIPFQQFDVHLQQLGS